MRFYILLFSLVFVFQCNTIFAQQTDIYSSKALNLEAVSSEQLDHWEIKQVNIELDSIKKYSGSHSIKLTPTRCGDKSLSKAIYSIPAYYMKGDQSFYTIDGDSLELCGQFSFESTEGANSLIILHQKSGSSQILENAFELNWIGGNREWNPFSIKVPLQDSLCLFSIEIVLNRNISLWLDDLHFSVDGHDVDKALKLCFKADEDHEFDQCSSISISHLTSQQADNLEVLAKVWGFAKYYHPDIAKGDIQWDYELFRIMPKILNATNKKERNHHLTKWIKHINQNLSSERLLVAQLDTTDCYVLPNLEWISDRKLLSRELVAELNMIKNAQRIQSNYYLQFDKDLGSIFPEDFPGEKHYPLISWEDQGYRLLTLFRYWNAIEYSFPYKGMTDLDWNQVFKKHLSSFVQTDSESIYLKSIYALTAEINDSHGYMYSSDPYMFAAMFAYVEGQLFVKKSFSCQLKAGDIILKMDGKNINEIIEERKPFVSASNETKRENFIISEMNRWNKNQLEAVCLRDNDTITVMLTDFNLMQEIPGCTSSITPYNYQNKLLEKNIIYLHISEISAESLTLIEDSIMQSNAIILDCRGYPNHDSFYEKLGDLLISHPINYFELSNLDIKSPGTFRLDPSKYIQGTEKSAYKGQVIILVNQSTQSAAETAVMIFQKIPNSITMGSPSSGANGTVKYLTLPGNQSSVFTGEGCYYPHKIGIQRKGVKLDMIVTPSKRLFLEGRDDQLEKAIEIIENSYK